MSLDIEPSGGDGGNNNADLSALSLHDLIARKTKVIEESHKQINDLEQDYFSQMNQLYMIKQSIVSEYQQTLVNQLTDIDNALRLLKQHSPPHSRPSLSIASLRHVSPSIKKTDIRITNNNSNNSNSSSSAHGQSNSNPTNGTLVISALPNFPSIPVDIVKFKDDIAKLGMPTLTPTPSPVSMATTTATTSTGMATNIAIKTLGNNSNTRTKTERIKDEKKGVKVGTQEGSKSASMNAINGNSGIQDSVQCTRCRQSFDGEPHLRKHMEEVHTFRCDVCGKEFGKSIDLRRHQRMHNGVSVYECKICYKTYTSASSLHNHMRLHEVSRLFRCEYCGKGFCASHHLKRHIRIHTGVTPFSCRYCSRPFKYKTSCRRHERTVHKEEYVPLSSVATPGRPKSKN